MLSIDRAQTLKLFGYLQIDPKEHTLQGPQQAKLASMPRTIAELAKLITEAVIDALRTGDSSELPDILSAVESLKRATLQLNILRDNAQSTGFEAMKKIIRLNNELAELKYNLLTLETEDELVAFQKQLINENKEDRAITDAITYLDFEP
jgi:hypothetical protein